VSSPFFTAKFVRISLPFVVITVLMLALAIVSMEILAAARAYVGGEGLWSKAQKDAVAYLTRYARTRDAADYRRFREALAVPLGDRVAREAIAREPFDHAAAARGFVAGGNHPDDVGRMIWLLRTFGHLPALQEVVAIWAAGDELIAQLDATGAAIDARIRSGVSDAQALAALVDEVERLNQRLRPLEDAFSAALGAVSRQVAFALLVALTVLAAVFLGVASWISRSMLRRTELAEAALRSSEAQMQAEQERAQVTLGSIRDGVVSTDADGRVRYLNAAAAQIGGWTQEAAGEPLHRVFRLVDGAGAEPVAAAVARLLAEGGASSIRDALLVRRDGSQVPVDASLAPIRDRHGKVLGVVAAFRDVSQERELAAQLRHQAAHDALTGLLNRREFEGRVRAALAEAAGGARQFTALYIDLDQFKVVNDTCGHPAGDQLICQVAELMASSLRAGDTLARLGGDEFGVLLADCPLASALAVAEKLRARIGAMRFAWRDRTFVIGVSIGAVTLDATMRSEADVLAAADSACYLAKEGGRNRVKVYQPDDQQLRARSGEMEWVAKLAAALEENRFELYAQEIRPVGGGGAEHRFEVLVRLVNESDDLIAPMAFIPAAERYGLMPRIDRWVIEHAIAELALRRRGGLPLPVLVVNLSGASIVDPGLPALVRERLGAAGVPADRLCFELTETATVTNLPAAARLMRELKHLGCSLGLDDFGSGMSSFGYLRSLPVDFIKIDGHFVKNIHNDPIDRAMVAAIHAVGHVMGVRTVAEWVEHEATLAELAAIGVDFAQGYAIARPQPLTAALKKLGALQPERQPMRLVHRAGKR
jgi:diguanylate cyclase (GGDEF)-like protein/PAS domain S-box-containing protein